MTLNQIALQNLRRRPGKTIFLILVFTFIGAVISSLTILAMGMKEDLQKSLMEYGANVVISPRTEELNLSYGGLSVSSVEYEVKKLPGDTVELIAQEVGSENGSESSANIGSEMESNTGPVMGSNKGSQAGSKIGSDGSQVTIAPKVIGSVEGENLYMIIGLDFQEELRMKPWWRIQGDTPQNNEVVLGFQLAMDSNLNIGDTIELKGTTYPIVGIMSDTGGPEGQGVFTTIPTARQLTGIDSEWSLIELNTSEPGAVVAQLAPLLPEVNVAEVTQLVQGSRENVERFTSFSWTVSLAMGIIGTLVIIVTLAGNVQDRVRELGVLRAIGFRQKHIISLLGREIIIISLAGSLLGYLLGIFAPYLLGPLLGYGDLTFSPHYGLGVALIISSLLVGLVAMIYPAWRTLKMELHDVLRYF
ncbi:MAG: FtsX-like permease family protein [Desulfitobacterium sp.]|nr:FtsX-like permease family protein [Desulfitobacterium sp.]